MSEFFVRKQHRRVGMGRDAATLIFDRFAGDWLIVEYLRNPGSVAFWRRVVAGYCGGAGHTERTRHGEVQQRFKSGPPTLRCGRPDNSGWVLDLKTSDRITLFASRI